MRTGLLGKLLPDWASSGDASARAAARHAAAAAASRPHRRQRADRLLGCGRMGLSLIFAFFVFAFFPPPARPAGVRLCPWSCHEPGRTSNRKIALGHNILL